MARDWFPNSETMVYVQGAVGTDIEDVSELGLTDGPVRIKFLTKHKEIFVDDYGPDVPAELLGMASEARISMDLVHFDFLVLAECIKASYGGPPNEDGTMTGVGWPIGCGLPYSPEDPVDARFVNRYVRLSIATLVPPGRGRLPWTFYSCVLTGEPVEIPLGVERSIFRVNWRAIPYSPPADDGSISSNNAILFDHNDLTSPI